jgi:hypothetical protein
MQHEKCFIMSTISYIVAIYSPDYIMTIIVEISLKNGARTYEFGEITIFG